MLIINFSIYNKKNSYAVIVVNISRILFLNRFPLRGTYNKTFEISQSYKDAEWNLSFWNRTSIPTLLVTYLCRKTRHMYVDHCFCCNILRNRIKPLLFFRCFLRRSLVTALRVLPIISAMSLLGRLHLCVDLYIFVLN